MKKKILIFNRYYLPGYKAGGPIKSIKILINKVLLNDFEIDLICRDRDFKDNNSYKIIKSNKWNHKYNIKIFYTKTRFMNLLKINFNKYDLIFFNSFFDILYTLYPLIYLKIFINKKLKIIINPRGELSKEALQIKWIRKTLYIYFLKLFKLIKNIIFQVTTKSEKKIIKYFFKNKSVVIPNLTEFKIIKKKKISINKNKFVYLSRITPKKNLLETLNILKKIKINYVFHIYGPIDDTKYWGRCLKIIKYINTREKKIFYKGIIQTNKVKKVLSKYDLFILISKNENFSHAISESLQSYVPILTSNTVYWKELKKYNLGWNVRPSDENEIVQILNNFNSKKKYIKNDFSKNLKRYLRLYYNEKEIIRKYKELFLNE